MAAPDTTKPKSYFTTEKILGRWLSLMSATIAGTSGGALQNMVPDQDGNFTLAGATRYSAVMLVIFIALAAAFYVYKKKLDAAADDETKDGILDLTPSEILSLTVDESINNFTAALSAVVAAVWFGFLTANGPETIFVVLFLGTIILVIGEFIQLQCKKGTMAMYIVKMINSMNNGQVSWFVGLGLSNWTENILGAPSGFNKHLMYWMYLVALIVAIALMETFNVISTKLPKTGESKPYGSVIMSMLKGIPMYSSSWVLNDIVQSRWNHDYINGTVVWCAISAVVILGFDQLLHMPAFAPGTKCGASAVEAKFTHHLATETVSLLQQSFAFICGQMLGFALPGGPMGFHWEWVMWGVALQVIAFGTDTLRHQVLPKYFKDVSARVAATDYVCLAGA